MDAKDVVELAKKHVTEGSMPSSAMLCLTDAVGLLRMGNEYYAKKRALDSLAYSVGVFHPDWILAKA
jgi:hypothetical protein